ncbi:MAG: hypothetical protein QW532_07275 [Archaeoglobaceae archaeon]
MDQRLKDLYGIEKFLNSMDYEFHGKEEGKEGGEGGKIHNHN